MTDAGPSGAVRCNVLSFPAGQGEEPEGRPAGGKFLQLLWRGEDYLVFADREVHGYHNQILAHFLADRGIPHRWLAQDRLEADHPALRVLGGGRFRLDRAGGRLYLWDDSQAYGRFVEARVREGLAGAAAPWSKMTLVIG